MEWTAFRGRQVQENNPSAWFYLQVGSWNIVHSGDNTAWLEFPKNYLARGVDIFLFEPHINIDSDEDAIRRFADKVSARGFVVGSVVAPVWPPTGGGSAMGSDEERKKFVELHGGTIRASSSSGHGSAFVFTIPTAP